MKKEGNEDRGEWVKKGIEKEDNRKRGECVKRRMGKEGNDERGERGKRRMERRINYISKKKKCLFKHHFFLRIDIFFFF